MPQRHKLCEWESSGGHDSGPFLAIRLDLRISQENRSSPRLRGSDVGPYLNSPPSLIGLFALVHKKRAILQMVHKTGVERHIKVPPGEFPVSGENASSHPVFKSLDASVKSWIEDGSTSALVKWLDRELDHDGVPKRLAVHEWETALRVLAEAREHRREDWPESFDAIAEGWFRATLRFARPGGSPAFIEARPDKTRGNHFRKWADLLSDPGLTTVVDWWFPRASSARHSAPPLPADARPDRPLGVLRANWSRDGDFLAIDHRTPGTDTTFELFGGGIPWLGPVWRSGVTDTEPTTRPRPTHWSSHGSADVLEWGYRVGSARVTRTAVLLRCRQLALLGEQWNGAGDPGEFRLSVAKGIQAGTTADSRAIALKPDRGRGSACVYPIGLARLPYATERGDFTIDGSDLVLKQPVVEGQKRGWRAVLVSWEPKRNRQPVHWRTLTVSENSKECLSGTAFATRITWGRDDTLLIYRSLNTPGLRACLGHQTRSRFLIGLFTSEGEVEPLVKL